MRGPPDYRPLRARWRRRLGAVGAAVAALVFGSGCGVSHETTPACHVVRVAPTRQVDLLLMVDNSGSMAEEQASLTVQFPRLLRALTKGDLDADGVADFAPVEDLHLGVITSDLGNGGFPVPTCATTFGDDGILITRGNVATAGCLTTYPPFLTFTPGADVDSVATDFACVGRVGTGGCGFEQPLEAVLKAVTPSTSPTRFLMGSTGHADRENAGFLREDSIVAVMVMSDEDDCSVADPALFDPSSTHYTGDLNLRCFMHPEAVHPVSRFVDGLRAVRPGRPELLVFAAITGIPYRLVADGTPAGYATVLSDPRMQEQIDSGAMMTRLTPSCNVPGRGLAFPPRRIVQVAEALAPRSMVHSICQEDFSGAIDALVAKIADALGGTCLARPLTPSTDGSVACDVREIVPAGAHCDPAAGRTFLRASRPEHGEPDGRDVCSVAQASRAAGTGWYYDDSATATALCGPARPRIAFTSDALPAAGSELQLDCADEMCGG